MTFAPRSKPTQKASTPNQRAAQAAAFDAMCKDRPLRPPTSKRPELNVRRKPLPAEPKI